MTNRTKTAKKRVVTSFANLTHELQCLFKEIYPTGYTDHMIRIGKPNGEFFYGVMLETEEVNYLVKVNVKIDDVSEEDIDKDIYDASDSEDIKGAEDIPDTEED